MNPFLLTLSFSELVAETSLFGLVCIAFCTFCCCDTSVCGMFVMVTAIQCRYIPHCLWFLIPFIQLYFFLYRCRKNDSLTTRQCIRRIYAQDGFFGFYKGISASYVGVTETVIHFVIYESIKAQLLEKSHSSNTDERSYLDFLKFMFAGACSKTCATCIAYPHGKYKI